MQQTPAEREDQRLRRARSALIVAERTRQKLSQEKAVTFINVRLQVSGHAPIKRSSLANIEACLRPLREPHLRAIAAALGINEAELRNPRIEILDAA